MSIHKALLDVLVCPICHGNLKRRTTNSLYCAHCDHSYSIEDGIPDMLPPDFHSMASLNEGDALSSVKLANISFYVNREREREKWHVHPSKIYGYPRMLDFMMSHFNRSGMRVLDACCGVGMVSSYLHQQGLKPYSFDISRDSLKSAIASDRNLKAIFRADAENMPLRPCSFDGVCYCASLHHLPNPYQGMAEACRVLKKGGKLILIEPNDISIGFMGGVIRAVLALPVRPRRAVGELAFTFKKSLAEILSRETIESKGKQFTRDRSGRWIGVGETEQDLSLPYVLGLARMAGFKVLEVRTQKIAIKLVNFFTHDIDSKRWRRLQRLDQMIFKRVPFLNKYGDLMLLALQKP